MIPAIDNRRSIRKFKDQPIPKKDITDILQSGTKAPSSKNSQPWKYIVIQGRAKEEMLNAFRQGIERGEGEGALPPQVRPYLSAAKCTIEIMAAAPVIVFVVDPLGKSILSKLTQEERIYELCSIQSISASIQNMLLSATEKGIGSLWICDIYFAYSELSEWLGGDGQLVAAVAFGYPDECPGERPRKKLDDVTEWRN